MDYLDKSIKDLAILIKSTSYTTLKSSKDSTTAKPNHIVMETTF